MKNMKNMKKQLIILFSAVTLASVMNGWFWNNHYFQSPIKRLEFQCMICKGVIVPLLPQKPQEKASTSKINKVKGSVSTNIISEQLDPSDKEIAKYIKSKSWNYEDAIRLAKSENFWNLTKSFNCSRVHTNTNGTIDVGIFQINSIQTKSLAKLGMTMEDMKDCYKNIDYAYRMWSSQGGFQAWSAWNNKSYLNHSVIEL